MNWLRRFYSNHVLANLTFLLILVIGVMSYLDMPRARDPEINFNWINIVTILPGASAGEIEKRITDPIEDSIRRSVPDIKFVSSTSREGISNILVRFNQLDSDVFEKRLIDLRREVQNTYTDELPSESENPVIYEITSSSSLPAATVVVQGLGNDENLRRNARNVKDDIERISGVDRVNALGFSDPELHVAFIPERLAGLGITPADLADTVRSYFRDVSVGDIDTIGGKWVVRLKGTDADPASLASFPITTAQGVVPLGNLAELTLTTEEAQEAVAYAGEPSVMFTITKKPDINVLELIGRISAYIEKRNQLTARTGVELVLVDDQTVTTKHALSLMQNNALIGLALVLLVTWLFLGSRIALLTSIGIPLTLAGTFFILSIGGMSLNNMVLLGIVIALGMLVDDAVVVVEAIYHRLQQGISALDASIASIQEVFAPVTTSVLTTIAAFLPLMLLPGILGDFMKVIPITVCLALLVSLIEAYWMLPTHITAAKVKFTKPTKTQRLRTKYTHWLRLRYTQSLFVALRNPKRSVAIVVLVLVLAVSVLFSGLIRYNFFAADALRLFYVNIEMDSGSSLTDTAKTLSRIEKHILTVIEPEELRASLVYAGQQFNETEQLFGDTVGQIMISLNPEEKNGRHVEKVADAVEEKMNELSVPGKLSMLRLKDGPPVTRAISVKVRGENYPEILNAANDLTAFMEGNSLFKDITLDYRTGNPELVLKHNGDAIKRAGISPTTVTRAVQAYVDGELITQFQSGGEEVSVRLIAKKNPNSDIDALLRQTLSLPGGGAIALGDLVTAEYGHGQQNIRHYNFRRTITVDADIDKEKIDTVRANQLVVEEWQRLQGKYPNISLDFTGELDDIQESLDSIWILFTLGIGLIYIILGTQFASYWQPFMVLISVPLALTGVVAGLLITGNPMSLYTLYGVVALAGISVNAAIVLISAANSRLREGMSLVHATVFAARRRFIPIIITSLTTIAGLFSLAAGLAGDSLVWGPVATAIVSGLICSTALTLFVIPLLYGTFMKRSVIKKAEAKVSDNITPSRAEINE